jgi:hypothetical protein
MEGMSAITVDEVVAAVHCCREARTLNARCDRGARSARS